MIFWADHSNPYKGEKDGCYKCGGPHKPWKCPEKKKQDVAQALVQIPPPEGADKGKWKTGGFFFPGQWWCEIFN